ncbi:hypothetical protein LSH36_2111g00007 [Paralvinella palmiformis]|uniref:Thioredoxin domain-containing protein n=1 Tax=Paralvinella palmiformis TaxID=53620 RepID=A0AAD9MPK8_9ANNE|nr:hypothetical protein LSH36_2111g00007 [Paralvinella palmiformis]
MLAPIVDEVSKELDGKVKVAKVNVDENPDLAQQYGIVMMRKEDLIHILFKAGVKPESQERTRNKSSGGSPPCPSRSSQTNKAFGGN